MSLGLDCVLHLFVRKNLWFDSSNIVPTFKSGYVSLSGWATFRALVHTIPARIEGIQKNFILNCFSLFWRPTNTSTTLFSAKKNCGPHRTKPVCTYLQEKGLEVIQFTVQSSDLNPSVNAWTVLKRRLHNHRPFPRIVSELFTAMQHVCHSISDPRFINLVKPRLLEQL